MQLDSGIRTLNHHYALKSLYSHLIYFRLIIFVTWMPKDHAMLSFMISCHYKPLSHSVHLIWLVNSGVTFGGIYLITLNTSQSHLEPNDIAGRQQNHLSLISLVCFMLNAWKCFMLFIRHPWMPMKNTWLFRPILPILWSILSIEWLAKMAPKSVLSCTKPCKIG